MQRATPPDKRRQALHAPWRRALAIVALLGLALGLRRRCARYEVLGDSMQPTLAPGDWLLAWQRPPPRCLRPGRLVVAGRPDAPTMEVIKRVAARQGDALVLRGDNPAASTDSRAFGPLAAAAVTGLVCLRYWPPHRARWLL